MKKGRMLCDKGGWAEGVYKARNSRAEQKLDGTEVRGEASNRFSLRTFRGSQSRCTMILDLKPPEEAVHFCCLKPSDCGTLLWQPYPPLSSPTSSPQLAYHRKLFPLPSLFFPLSCPLSSFIVLMTGQALFFRIMSEMPPPADQPLGTQTRRPGRILVKQSHELAIQPLLGQTQAGARSLPPSNAVRFSLGQLRLRMLSLD